MESLNKLDFGSRIASILISIINKRHNPTDPTLNHQRKKDYGSEISESSMFMVHSPISPLSPPSPPLSFHRSRASHLNQH